MLKNDLVPTRVEKINCPKCGELMVKIYPWSSIRKADNQIIPNCRKCIAEHKKIERATQIAMSKKKIVR